MNTNINVKNLSNEEILEKINYCEKAVKASESIRQTAIGKKDAYEVQVASLDKELEEMGTTAKDAEADIAKIDSEMESLLGKVETLIPFDLLKQYKLI